MKPAPVERAVSFGLATLLHAAAGLALLFMPPPGGGHRGSAAQDNSGILLVELIPAEQGVQAAANAIARVEEKQTESQPQLQSPRKIGLQMASPSRTAGAATAADFGHPVPATQPGSAASDLSGSTAISYRQTLLAHIARFRHYPPDAYRDRLQGSVEIRFILNRDGSVEQAWVATSSGRQMFDQEALAAIRRAAPMPVIPADLPAQVDISLPIDFEIG